MSLGKLLATGRSLVGGAPDEGRYNISSRNRLPKFGLTKNPFAPSATSEPKLANTAATGVPQVELHLPVTQPSVETVDERIAAFVATSEIVCEPRASVPVVSVQAVQHDETQRIPELADEPFGSVGQLSVKSASWQRRLMAGLQAGVGFAMSALKWVLQFVRGIKWGLALSGCRAVAISLWPKAKTLFAKLVGLFRKSEPKQVFPRLGKPAVQTELSLDSVKVVRNSLEDSDLEIVTAPTATSATVAPTTPAASPKRGPVPPALKKMTERLLGVPTAD